MEERGKKKLKFSILVLFMAITISHTQKKKKKIGQSSSKYINHLLGEITG